jgi:hypothetical protein
MAFQMLAPIPRLFCNVTQQLSSSIKNTQDYVASSKNKVAQNIPAQSNIQFGYNSVSALGASKFNFTNNNNMDDPQQQLVLIHHGQNIDESYFDTTNEACDDKDEFMRLP